jgi:hypothetical protein
MVHPQVVNGGEGYYDDRIKEGEMGEKCSYMEKMRNAYKILFGKAEGNT